MWRGVKADLVVTGELSDYRGITGTLLFESSPAGEISLPSRWGRTTLQHGDEPCLGTGRAPLVIHGDQ